MPQTVPQAYHVQWRGDRQFVIQPDTNVLRTLLAKLCSLRRNSARLKSIPPEVISKLDGAIEVVENAMVAHKAGVDVPRAA